MTEQQRTAAAVDAYFDALGGDPRAAPTGLDAETAAVIRAVVTVERAGEALPAAARARIWRQASAALGPVAPAPWWRSWLPNAITGMGVAMLAVVIAVMVVAAASTAHRDEPGTLAAAEILARARTAAVAPAADAVHGLATSEVVEVRAAGRGDLAFTRIEVERRYSQAGRWRIESRTTLRINGVEEAGPLAVALSDGAQVLTFTSGESTAIVGPITDWRPWLALGPLGPAPGTRTGPTAMVLTVLREAGRCLHAAIVGRSTVAGRAGYVVALDRWVCDRESPEELAGTWRLVIDRETSSVLRATQQVDGAVRLTAEVVAFDANPHLDDRHFDLLPPDGVQVRARIPASLPSVPPMSPGLTP